MESSKAYAVMDYVPGKTLNELAYRNPNVLEENKIRIAFQLGMHTAFSYVFGLKDGYQSNYIFDPDKKTITRVDNERFLHVPEDPENTLDDNHPYTQAIAACELENLKYMPSFRRKEALDHILKAFNAGFIEKYGEIKNKKETLIRLIGESRADTFRVRPDVDAKRYQAETEGIVDTVGYLIDQDPLMVLKRLYKAKTEVKK